MKVKDIWLGVIAVYAAYQYGKGAGYGKCMVDVVNQHSNILPDGKLTLEGCGKKRKYSISVSKPKETEEA